MTLEWTANAGAAVLAGLPVYWCRRCVAPYRTPVDYYCCNKNGTTQGISQALQWFLHRIRPQRVSKAQRLLVSLP